MIQEQSVPRTRLIVEAITAVAVFFVMGVVVITATYLFIEGYTREAIEALRTPEGAELVKYYAFLTAPVSMLLTIFVVHFMQRLRGQGFAELGLKKPDNIVRTILYGLGVGVAAYVVALAVQNTLAYFGLEPDLQDFAIIQGDFYMYLFAMTAISWLAAGLGEEILFRGFILNNLSQAFGGTKGAMTAAIMIQALFFGALHLNQDIAGALTVFSMALVFGFAYMKLQNLWPLIIGHSLVDNLSFSLLYLQNGG